MLNLVLVSLVVVLFAAWFVTSVVETVGDVHRVLLGSKPKTLREIAHAIRRLRCSVVLLYAMIALLLVAEVKPQKYRLGADGQLEEMSKQGFFFVLTDKGIEAAGKLGERRHKLPFKSH